MVAIAAEPDRGMAPVRPIHTAVRGRARLHVAALRRRPDVKRRLELGLRTAPGISHVQVSTVTSNVLVHFDPALSLATVVDRLVASLRDDAPIRDASGPVPWHAMDAGDVAKTLASALDRGLSARDAEVRIAAHGRNIVKPAEARSALSMLVDQFNSLPVALLAVAAGVSLLTGGAVLEAAAIAAVIGLNAAIGYATESRAERTIRGLSQGGHPMADVIRDGAIVNLSASAVVPGDLLVLRRGSLVAADARVIAARDLTVSEAVLTGESLPVTKVSERLRPHLPLGDRVNMIYRGTVCTGGSGTALVVATGADTEAGRIQHMIAAAGVPMTPLQRQLGDLGRQLALLSAAICGGVFGVGVLRGMALLQLFRSAVSLAVAAIPEGLPAVATTTLAIGIEELRKRDVLVRRLDAVETLAAVDVICFDKTGTVTMNQMAVARIVCGTSDVAAEDAEQGGSDPRLAMLLDIAALCSETTLAQDPAGRRLSGSSTENALVERALATGIDVEELRDRYPTLSVRQRTEAYRFMATIHGRPGGGLLVAVKGSPSEVLARCRWEMQPDGGRAPLTDARRDAILRGNDEMAGAALRVLGFAYAESNAATSPVDLEVQDLTWVGLAGLADPVRPGMRELMAAFHRAGIRTVLVTGDQATTARTVAQELGLSPDGMEPETVDAVDLVTLPPDELARAARRAHVFARVSPGQKLEIVRALQQSGSVVAMTGDGVNDGPALKAADIGVALGRNGADAAREVADIVLETDDLTALARAVEQGRTTHVNIGRSIRYLLSTNLSEIFVVLGGTAAGIGDALSPIQLLWINLISDVLPGIGLACEPARAGALARGPVPAGTPIVGRDDAGTLFREGALLGAGALSACAFGAIRYGAAAAETRTMTFTSLVIAQMLHALTCRTNGAAAAGPLPPNRLLWSALALSLGAQAAALLIPGLRSLLGVAPIGLADVAATVASGAMPYLINSALPTRSGARSRPVGLPQITAPNSIAAERSKT